jgi:hypothetical protein
LYAKKLIDMKKIFLLLATVMVAAGASAQGAISGRVYDADTGEALPYVTVAVRGRGVGVISDRDSEILSFRLLVRQNEYDNVPFRLSFYSLENGMPGELIVHKDIRFEIKDRFTGWFEVDLTPYGIGFTGEREILVAITRLEEKLGEPKPFALEAVAFSRGFYSRTAGDENWERISAVGLTFAMYLNARVYR